MTTDQQFMHRAIELAERARGHVSPNPLVGCVVVKNGNVLAEGYHKRFGGDHAEVVALKKLRFTATGATLYVSLEPCHHVGKTPPCVNTVIQAGVKRVVIAMRDPNPLTAGKSIRKLKRAGIEVTVGVCRNEALRQNSSFVKAHTKGLPFVVAKVAQSLDGKIAAKKGTQTQITGREAMAYVQKLRAQVDAILVGRSTVEIDDPRLNVRNRKSPQPKRVILDSNLKLKGDEKIFRSHGGKVILVCGLKSDHPKVKKWQKRGVEVLCVSRTKQGLSLKHTLKHLLKTGIQSVLLEGGSQVFTSFAKAHLVDEYRILMSPKIYGPLGVPAFASKMPLSAHLSTSETLGPDLLLTFKKR